jgi:hypothetical protein
MLREKFVTKRQFEVFSRNLDRKLNSLKIPSFTVPDDNYDPEDVPGSVPTGGVAYQILYTDSFGAGQWNMPGTANVIVGENAVAGGAGTDVAYGVIIGEDAGYSLIARAGEGSSGTLIGYRAGYGITEGVDNICIGDRAGYKITTGGENICIGTTNTNPGGPITGDANILIGPLAGYGLDDGGWNTCIGDQAGYNLIDGGFNVLIGPSAGKQLVSGLYNIMIGTGDVAIASDRMMAIGIGLDACPDADNKCRIGGTGPSAINIDIGGVYMVDGLQVVGARIADADFANTPDTGDADTDDLIDKMRDALLIHGLVSTS